MKDESFWKVTKVGDRLSRTLVKERDRFFTVATAPSIPDTYKYHMAMQTTLSPSHIQHVGHSPNMVDMDDSIMGRPEDDTTFNMDVGFKSHTN